MHYDQTDALNHIFEIEPQSNFNQSKARFSLFKPGWSNFCTLVGHFSKLFEFAGLSRLKIPIFVPKSGCSLKKKKRSSLGIGLQNSYFRSKIRCSLKKKKKVFTWNRSPKFLFWRKIIAFSKKKLRLLLLIDKT